MVDAASGFTRTLVVLYACAFDGGDVILDRLRQFAFARDWVVVRETVDHFPIASSLSGRPGWERVAEDLEAGRASGVVTDARATCGYHPEERERVDAWLADRMAFIAVVPTARIVSRNDGHVEVERHVR